TDLQPQLVACSCTARGITAVIEKVFPKRFAYVEQLKDFGAKAEIYDNLCLIEGSKLHGAKVVAGDLRGGAALIVGALSAEGDSEIRNVSHVDRGYYKLEEKLSSLGAKIRRERY
ncbi:MAG: UDP-N-acetylglucosamine 1-carboxyvinyltransferase, partial [Clostridia bacterium]|nr:UDP-N-acetylglucosamine 1-carboxyvinyltransferase [Clostridia bacterium]